MDLFLARHDQWINASIGSRHKMIHTARKCFQAPRLWFPRSILSGICCHWRSTLVFSRRRCISSTETALNGILNQEVCTCNNGDCLQFTVQQQKHPRRFRHIQTLFAFHRPHAFHRGTEAAHLVNFMGTDTVAALLCTKRYYHAKMLFCKTSNMKSSGVMGRSSFQAWKCPGVLRSVLLCRCWWFRWSRKACGHSIPASEHSTITSWGVDGEVPWLGGSTSDTIQ